MAGRDAPVQSGRPGRAAPHVKFCGLTRVEDAALGATLGARYLGVIFAGGPRLISPERAAALFAGAPGTYRRVGVFGSQPAEEIARVARGAGLSVVQLHGDPSPDAIDRVRASFDGEVWAVVRTTGVELPGDLRTLFATADAVVLDAKVAGALGGTGVALDWESIAPRLEDAREAGRLVLAGGLTPGNVRRAADLLRPDVVDVSSGVERSPGTKDAARMRAFVEALG
jgi:phosphoribosylanthranilate isomerase